MLMHWSQLVLKCVIRHPRTLNNTKAEESGLGLVVRGVRGRGWGTVSVMRYIIYAKEEKLSCDDDQVVVVGVGDRFYIDLFSVLEQTHRAPMGFYMSD